DRMAELFPNADFMRFSLGPMNREQSETFLGKILGWDRAGLPSPFAVIDRESETLIGYCGFLHQEVEGRAEIEIGYRFDPRFWNRRLATEAARAVRDHAFRGLAARTGHFVDSSGQPRLASRDREERNAPREKNNLQSLSDVRLFS